MPDSTGETDYLVDDTPNPDELARYDLLLGRYHRPGQHRHRCCLQPGRAERPVDLPGHCQRHERLGLHPGPDPGAGYTLYKVVRSDGTVIPVSDQAWTTDRTIAPTGKSTVDYELHILDDNSTGSYLVYYKPTTTAPPAVASLSTVSSPQSGPVDSIDVTFSEPIDPSTFTTPNLILTLNGGPNLINSSVTIMQDSPTTYTIGGLSALTAPTATTP